MTKVGHKFSNHTSTLFSLFFWRRVLARQNHKVSGDEGVKLLSMMLNKNEARPPDASRERFDLIVEVRDEEAVSSALEAYCGGCDSVL